MEKQVDKSIYDFKKYVSKMRWMSYWHQMDEILNVEAENILIIGDGDGLIRKMLLDRIKVSTLDIDEEMKPDFLGSITDLDLICNIKFDIVLCCQVLEHIPFTLFEECLKKISKITSKKVIISLPQKYYRFQVGLYLWKNGKEIRYICNRKNVKHAFDGEHYWEIGAKGCSLSAIRSLMKKYFVIEKDYTSTNPYHHFFILSPQSL